jgi:hypothetical protein
MPVYLWHAGGKRHAWTGQELGELVWLGPCGVIANQLFFAVWLTGRASRTSIVVMLMPVLVLLSAAFL